MCYYRKKHKDDEERFKEFITFGKDRMPLYRIDYGSYKRPERTLHVHYYKDEYLIKNYVEYLHPGDELYEKHKKLFKGVRETLTKARRTFNQR